MDESNDYTGRYWAVILICLLNFIVYISIMYTNKSLYSVYAFSLAGVGQNPLTIIKLVTTQFVHGDLHHLLANTGGVIFFGTMLTFYLSNKSIFIGYVGVGAITTAIQSLVIPISTITIIGGSGGVFFLCALVICFQYKELENRFLSYGTATLLPILLGDQTYKLLTSTNSTGYTSHIAGTIIGIIAFGYILYRIKYQDKS